MRLFLILVLTVALLYSHVAEAQSPICPQLTIEQITEPTDRNSEDPTINADGRYVAFRSSADLIGENPNLETQVFLFDRLFSSLVQITNDPDEASLAPSINADGNFIALESDSDINGGNAGNDRQIYVYNVTTSIFTQITAADRNSSRPSINSDAMWVAFQSSANLTGQNPDFSTEIFLANVNSLMITQITADPDPGFNIDSQNPSISGDGNIIAFDSNSNIEGLNPEEVRQIFYYNVAAGTFTKVTQVTGTQSSLSAAISADGKFIVYRSSQNINGRNPEENTEIWLYEIATGQNTQVTFTPTGQFAQNPSINGNGSLLTFESNGNFDGTNSNLDRSIWLYDVVNMQFTRVTDAQNDFSEHSRIAADALSIAFESRANINGDNPADPFREVYVADCIGPRNVPTLSEWGLIAMAGILGIVGFMFIRRRALTS